MNQDPQTRRESVDETADHIKSYVSPAGTQVTHMRYGPVSTGAMARDISATMSEWRGLPMNLMAGSDWLTFVGTDHYVRAQEASTLIDKRFVPSNPNCRGLSAVLVEGESGSSLTETVPSTTLVIGYDRTGAIDTQEELDVFAGKMQEAVIMAAERDMP